MTYDAACFRPITRPSPSPAHIDTSYFRNLVAACKVCKLPHFIASSHCQLGNVFNSDHYRAVVRGLDSGLTA